MPCEDTGTGRNHPCDMEAQWDGAQINQGNQGFLQIPEATRGKEFPKQIVIKYKAIIMMKLKIRMA